MPNFDDVFTTPGTSATITLRLAVSVASQSVALNRTTLSWSLKMIKGAAGNPSRAFNDCDAAVSVNGSVYSAGSLNYAFSSGADTITVASGTRNVTHNSDGTKSITVSASYDGKSPIGTAATGNRTMTLPKIARATTPTIAPNPVEFGQNIGIDLDPAVSTYYHDTSYEIGAANGNISFGDGASTLTWLVPLSLMNQTPNASAIAGKIIVTTYDEDGNIVGTVNTAVTFNVPATVVPTIGAITDTETVSDVNTLVGKYVQGKSKLALALTGSVGAYGSTIVSSKITVDGQTINASSGIMPTAFTGSGTLTISAEVTDSRGRKGTLTKNISVLPYAAPAITTATMQRSDSGGTVDAENGTYVRVDLNASVSSLLNGATQKNSLNYKLSYRAPGASTWIVKTGPITAAGLVFNSNFQNSGFPVTNAYELLLEVIDIFGSALVQRAIPVGAVFMHFDSSIGVGIGKYRQNGMLDVKGSIYQNSGEQVRPAGEVTMFGGATAPTGWLLCQGQSLLRTAYPALFAAISTTYGAADNTHFNVPDFRGRTPVGLDTSQTEFDVLGEAGGSKTHTHPLSNAGQAKISTVNGGEAALIDRITAASSWTPNYRAGSASAGAVATSGSAGSGTGLVGNTDSAPSLNPYRVLNFIIKA